MSWRALRTSRTFKTILTDWTNSRNSLPWLLLLKNMIFMRNINKRRFQPFLNPPLLCSQQIVIFILQHFKPICSTQLLIFLTLATIPLRFRTGRFFLSSVFTLIFQKMPCFFREDLLALIVAYCMNLEIRFWITENVKKIFVNREEKASNVLIPIINPKLLIFDSLLRNYLDFLYFYRGSDLFSVLVVL